MANLDRNAIVQQFDLMEQDVQALVSRVERVLAENNDLKTRIRALEKEASKKEAAASQFQREKDHVRSKIDELLTKLVEFNKS